MTDTGEFKSIYIMSDTEPPRLPENSRSIAPDAKKESEITDHFDFGLGQVKGPRREQQDYAAITPLAEGGDCLVGLVADGVGSLVRSAEASRMAGELFVAEVRAAVKRKEKLSVGVLRNILEIVNRRLLDEAERLAGEYKTEAEQRGERYTLNELAVSTETDMCTTFTGIIVQDGKIRKAHLGDSRLYRLRRGVIRPMTGDHTVAEWRRSYGVPEPDDNEERRRKEENILSNHLGSEAADFEVAEQDAESGDVWLAVSDGVYRVLSDIELRAILTQQKDVQSLANDIIEAVKAKGVVDDTTAVVVKVK